MKSHVKSHASYLALGGVFVPIALALATFIANEAQLLLGLDLDRVALALYLVPFLAGASACIIALVRLEAAKIGGELGKSLNGLAGLAESLFNPPGTTTLPDGTTTGPGWGPPGREGPPGAERGPEGSIGTEGVPGPEGPPPPPEALR